MDIMSFTFDQYLEGEHKSETEIREMHKNEIDLCINFWNFLANGLIKSVDRGAILFMYFYQPAVSELHLAITSIMRLHLNQCFQDLRLSLENIAICMYFLNCDQECNRIFLDSNLSEGKYGTNSLKKKAYDFLEKKYPQQNATIKRYKEYMSVHGSHANIGSAALKVKPDKEEVRTNFFDEPTPHLIKNSLMLISDIILGFCEAIIKQRRDPLMLPLVDDCESQFNTLKTNYLRHKQAMENYIHTQQKSRKPNEKCWCGSEIKFKKCHGRS